MALFFFGLILGASLGVLVMGLMFAAGAPEPTTRGER